MRRRRACVKSREYGCTLLSAQVSCESRWHRGYVYIRPWQKVILSRFFYFPLAEQNVKGVYYVFTDKAMALFNRVLKII